MRYAQGPAQDREEHRFTDEDALVESLRSSFWEEARRACEEPSDDAWEDAAAKGPAAGIPS